MAVKSTEQGYGPHITLGERYAHINNDTAWIFNSGGRQKHGVHFKLI